METGGKIGSRAGLSGTEMVVDNVCFLGWHWQLHVIVTHSGPLPSVVVNGFHRFGCASCL